MSWQTMDRWCKIDRALSSKTGLNVRDLARQCDVTPRTIQHDLHCLRTMYAVPIIHDRRCKVHRYAKKNFHLFNPEIFIG